MLFLWLVAFGLLRQSRFAAQTNAAVLVDIGKTKSLFGQAGLEVTKIVPEVINPPYKTTGGQKLTKGTRRRVLHLEAVVCR